MSKTKLPPGIPPAHERKRAYHVVHPNGDIDVYPPTATLDLRAYHKSGGQLSLEEIVEQLESKGIKVRLSEEAKAKLKQELQDG